MSVKSYIKWAGGAFCSSGLMKPLVRSRARSSVNVVYYHFVGKSGPHYDAFYAGCTLDRFSRDLEQLSEFYTFAPLADVVADGEKENPPQGKPKMAVTFDDGLDLRRTGVMEVLARFGAKATTFVITACVDNQHLMWQHKLSVVQSMAPEAKCVAEYNRIATRERLARIRSPRQLSEASTSWDMGAKDRMAAELWDSCGLPAVGEYLSTHKPYFGWDGLREWLAAGHSVGFHTHTHPLCERLNPTDTDAELVKPAVKLKETLGLQELFFAYPFGSRLPRPLEDELFSKRIFKALFGIKGFKKRGASNQRLERAGVEEQGMAWPVFAQLALRDLRNKDN